MKNCILKIGLIVFLLTPIFASELPQLLLQEITFYGCKNTSPDQLRRIIHFKTGSVFNETQANLIRSRLLNSGMFKEIDVVQRIVNDQVLLIISVEEKPPFILNQEVRFNAMSSEYPAEENELSYYGGTIQRVDFSGKHNNLSLNFGIGSQDRIALSFTKNTDRHMQYGLVAGYTHYDSLLFGEESKVKKGYAKIFLEKKWRFFTLRCWMERDWYWLPVFATINETDEKVSNFWRSGIRTQIDLRNNKNFPRHGFLLEMNIYRNWEISAAFHDALDVSVSLFSPALHHSHSLALNLSGHLAAQPVPVIDRFSLGGYRVLRTQKRYENSGSQALWGSLEYRLSIGNFNTDQKLNIASSPYLFLDFGVVGEKLKTMLDKHLEHNAGIGFLWQIGEGNILRLDFALSPKFGVVIGSNWKF